ncbi:hypothetical protein EG68_00654 [Paragonimus skrjabini miyazakii]|uniref:Sema domain-containing protein n=1 Tax=Paragonimus skrjabini miyazakii TaxID=59628 RepID=A0A8S9ZA12_9TREM|nr:hypothetical protein EG68_00654 [Paragonimus skrjabini miyazakii]
MANHVYPFLFTLLCSNFLQVIYSRIARVCTGDPGLSLPNDEHLYFTSFFKTRLICRISADQYKPEMADNHLRSNFERLAEDIEYNNLITMTQAKVAHSAEKDSVIYALFSEVDPFLAPIQQAKLGFMRPLALCAYRLSDVDRVIHQSDLIRLIPHRARTTNEVLARLSKFSSSNTNISFMPSKAASPRDGAGLTTNIKFQQIRRSLDSSLTTITDCPSPPRASRRLALEAPLLADPVYPRSGHAVGLIHLSSRVTVMQQDPRYIEMSVGDRQLHGDEWASFTKSSLVVNVFYLGTDVGEVYKLLVLETRHHRQHDTRNRTKSGDSSFRLDISQSTVMQKLVQMPSKREIKSILVVQSDEHGEHFIIRKHIRRHSSEPPSHIELLVLDGKDILTINTQLCSKAPTCHACVALRDPECFWNIHEKCCDQNITGLNNLLTGKHQRCSDSTSSYPTGSVTRISASLGDLSSSMLNSYPKSHEDETTSLKNQRTTKSAAFHLPLSFTWSALTVIGATCFGIGLGFVFAWLLIRTRSRRSMKSSTRPDTNQFASGPHVFLARDNQLHFDLTTNQIMTEPSDCSSALSFPVNSPSSIKNLLSSPSNPVPSFLTDISSSPLSTGQVYKLGDKKMATICLNNDLTTSFGDKQFQSEETKLEKNVFHVSVHS